MASRSVTKTLANLALIEGLNMHIEGAYKAGHIKKACKDISANFNDVINLWPDPLDKYDIFKIEQNIKRLEGFLNCQPPATLTSLMLAVVDELKQHFKGVKMKMIECLEAAIIRLHSRIDKTLKKDDCYRVADSCFKRFTIMDFKPNSQDKFEYDRQHRRLRVA